MKRIAAFAVVVCLTPVAGWAGTAGLGPQNLTQTEDIAPGADGYAARALALAREARQAADPALYRRAESAIAQSLALAPDNREARRVRVLVRLGEGEFAAALAEAQALNRAAPDDLLMYACLVDANLGLGNYAEAEQAAQWLLDMRPGNVLGLTRAAALREVFGDVDGALEFLSMALVRAPPDEREEQAWIISGMARLELMRGAAAPAEALASEALKRLPAYPHALKVLGRVQAALGRHRDAIATFRQLAAAAPRPGNYVELAHALRQAGRNRQAAAAFAEFERRARAEIASADNANHELALYYADQARKPGAALRVARLELARRHDVYTRDAYAWALHVNGRHQEALREMGAVLSLGIRDAQILQHAGAIARSAGDPRAARRYFTDAYALAPWLRRPARG